MGRHIYPPTPHIDVDVLADVIFSTVNVLKFLTLYSMLFLALILLFTQLSLKILSGLANSVDPDQTAPYVQSDLCQHCLHKPYYQTLRCLKF